MKHRKEPAVRRILVATNAVTPPASSKSQDVVQATYRKIQTTGAGFVGSEGSPRPLPKSLDAFLCLLLEDLKDGNSVTILQSNESLTTLEAARMLGVSRTYLLGLLEKKEIPYYLVGTHRRILARGLLAYRANRDIGRRRILDDLARAEFEEGLYDRLPNGTHKKQ
jgi:excisionase family DNA binding protein